MMSERSSATAFAFAFFNGGGLAIGGAGVAAFVVVPTSSTSLSDCSESGVITCNVAAAGSAVGAGAAVAAFAAAPPGTSSSSISTNACRYASVEELAMVGKLSLSQNCNGCRCDASDTFADVMQAMHSLMWCMSGCRCNASDTFADTCKCNASDTRVQCLQHAFIFSMVATCLDAQTRSA